MEPLVPSSAVDKLAALSAQVFQRAGALSAKIPSKIVRLAAAHLVREMNSYYSNLIEGHKTLPRDIENALRQDFSNEPQERANQRLTRAHIEVEELMLARLQSESELRVHSQEFICWLHGEFYTRLPDELHWSSDRAGKRYKITPGVLRDYEVVVGQHVPPSPKDLPEVLARFEAAYGRKAVGAMEPLVTLAASHHRLAWIHPFGDGNGRVTRLYSHACIVRAGIDAFGLWTLSRGLARQRERYFAALSAADQRRWNDLDGRGNLSDRALGDFCVFFLETMLDQITFMESLFEFETLAKRIDHHLRFERMHISDRQRDRLSRLLRAALIDGKIERGRVGEIVGLQGTEARGIIRLALSERLLQSPTEKGPLLLTFTSDTLESYFPKLYQDLPIH